MASELAAHIRRESGITGVPTTDEIAEIIRGQGAVLNSDQSFRGELLGVCIRRRIAVRQGLSEADRRHVLLHELSHFLMDSGNQHYYLRGDYWQARKQERRAELIAGWLLFEDAFSPGAEWTVESLAEHGNVPVEFVARWWQAAEWEIRDLVSGEADQIA